MKLKIELSFGIFKKRTEKCRSFIEKSCVLIDRMRPSGKYATVRNYQTSINSFDTFVKESKFADNQFDNKIVVLYEKWLRRHSVCANTSACYMRYLRALYNQLHTDAVASPFEDVVTINAATGKRSLSADDIRKIHALEFADNDPLGLYRDIFLFSLLTFGMPFVDLVRMRHSDIVNGTIAFNRQKTSKPVRVVILPEAQRILDKYRSEDSCYLFPQVSHSDNYQSYQHELAKYNKALHKLTELAETDVTLTSYVARHTWASLAYSNGVDLGIISQALGHTNLRTTQIYLRELDIEKMRSAGMAVMNSIC